ncbi:hypothetical protein JCM1840_003725 [Sporobolomyces johnsonii]
MSSPSSLTLPLSSLIASSSSDHPLPALVLTPLLSRISTLEAALLLSRPSALLRRLGCSDRALVGGVVLALLAALARSRRQWRGVLAVLGLGEAVGRTLGVVERAEKIRAETDKGKQRATHDERDEQDELSQEVQHLLSFWLLYALLSLLESLRSFPSRPSSSASSAVTPLLAHPLRLLRLLRHSYLRFLRLYVLPTVFRTRYAYRTLLEQHPRLDLAPLLARIPPLPLRLHLPGFLYALLSPPARPLKPTSFPQPLPRSSKTAFSTPALPLPIAYFSANPAITAEVKWQLVKLLILWTGSRRDGWGAKSVLWDWVVGPVWRSWSRRDGSGGAGTPEDEKREWRVVRVVRAKTEAEGDGQYAGRSPPHHRSSPDRPPTEQDHDHDPVLSPSPPLSPSPASAPSPSPSLSSPLPPHPPIWSTLTPPRSRSRLYPPPSLPSPNSPAFLPPPPPLQTIPYRLASSQHPLLLHSHAHAHSGSATSTSRGGSSSSSGGGKRGRTMTAAAAAAAREGAGAGGGRTNGVGSENDKRRSLLLESPPRSPAGVSAALDSDDDEEEEGEEKRGRERAGEVEALEGIKRWATVLRDAAEAREGSVLVSTTDQGSGWS